MPSCAFRKCTNNSRNTSKVKGITFHSFPQDTCSKEKWIRIIQEDLRDDLWLPTKFSRVCSAHFNDCDFYSTPLGLRKVKPLSVPSFTPTTVAVVTKVTLDQQNEIILGLPLHNVCLSMSADTGEIFDKPSKINLKKQLRNEKSKNIKYIRDISKRKKDNKHLFLRNTTLLQLVNIYKQTKLINKENLNELTKHAMDANKELLFTVFKKRRIIAPALKKFFIALVFHSPTAYRYIRDKFNSVLPHPRTIGKWFKSSNFSPGFTQQAFRKLRKKSANARIIATLVADEMPIRQETTWDGRKTIGLVDEGLGPKDEIATRVYVFMLVSNDESWKILLGYFFINGLQAEKRANLIQMCINKCYDAGVDVIALTFDGSDANFAVAEILGCKFQYINQLETTFPYPACNNKRVAIFFDPCHMLKLVKNTFESKKVLFSENGRIEWSYLFKLQKLKERDNFKFPNKPTVRQIEFRNQIMKVNLASPLLCRSVAKALIFCSEMLTEDRFKNLKATFEFVELFNNLFDIFNSRTYKQGFQSLLNVENESEIFDFLDKAEKYIKSLKICNKIKITSKDRFKIKISKKLAIEAKSKKGFLGLLINIKSLKYIYEKLVRTKLLNHLSTYRFSLDHSEQFFGLVRQQGGYNNNPTAEKFRKMYKKAFCYTELQKTFMGICLPIDNFSILICSSALENINKTTIGFRDTDPQSYEITLQSAEDEQCGANIDILCDILDKEKNSRISDQIVGYISGWIVKIIAKNIKCPICCDALIADEKLNFHMLINLKNLGGLILPTQDVYDICIKTEAFLKLQKKLQVNNNYMYTENQVKLLHIKILAMFKQSNVFENLNEHSFEQPATWNHKIMLIKSVIQHYANIRLGHIQRYMKQPDMRKFQKIILF